MPPMVVLAVFIIEESFLDCFIEEVGLKISASEAIWKGEAGDFLEEATVKTELLGKFLECYCCCCFYCGLIDWFLRSRIVCETPDVPMLDLSRFNCFIVYFNSSAFK